MRRRVTVLAASLFFSAAALSGCREASAPDVAPVANSASERAVLLLAEGGRAFGRVRVSELRAHLSQGRLDELGESILSKRFRLPVDVAREVDEIHFVAYQYGAPDAIALLAGRFRATELREALAREAAAPTGTAKEAPSVNGERFYRVGQGDLYVVADDMLAVGSRAAMDRFLRRVTGASPLTAFPLKLAPGAIAAARASGPSSAEELPAMLRNQPLAVGLRGATATLDRQGESMEATIVAEFADEELAKQAQARITPFARLLPTWTRNALPAAEVSLSGAKVVVREPIDPAKLESLAATASSVVPR
jgi:hypothetical protein